MRILLPGWQVLLAGLLVAPVTADDKIKARVWTQGELVEVHYETKGELREESGGERYTTKHRLKLVVIDRVDEVTDGKVVAITRHVKRVELVEDGDSYDDLGIEGRNVTLRRGAKGRISASFPDGERLSGDALRVVRSAPFPDVDLAFRLDLGSRKGKLQPTAVASFKAGDTPAFVGEALRESGLRRIDAGSWEVSVEPGFALAGKLRGKVAFSGKEEDDEGGAFQLNRTLELALTRKAPAGKQLPADTPPAAEADEGFDYDEDMDEGMEDDDPEPDPAPDDDPEPDPAPDDDPEPIPAPDDDGEEDW